MRGLTREIHENKTTAKITTYTVPYFSLYQPHPRLWACSNRPPPPKKGGENDNTFKDFFFIGIHMKFVNLSTMRCDVWSIFVYIGQGVAMAAACYKCWLILFNVITSTISKGFPWKLMHMITMRYNSAWCSFVNVGQGVAMATILEFCRKRWHMWLKDHPMKFCPVFPFFQASIAARWNEQVPQVARHHLPPRPQQLPAAHQQAPFRQGRRPEENWQLLLPGGLEGAIYFLCHQLLP